MSETSDAKLTGLVVTRDELAAALKMNVRSVDRLVKQGKLPQPVRIGGGYRFVTREVLKATGLEGRV